VTAIPVRWLTFWLDVPAGSFERERSFWTALTGWEGQDGARSVGLDAGRFWELVVAAVAALG
jgi:hypothetical protein